MVFYYLRTLLTIWLKLRKKRKGKWQKEKIISETQRETQEERRKERAVEKKSEKGNADREKEIKWESKKNVRKERDKYETEGEGEI